jgi:hypothetical protein
MGFIMHIIVLSHVPLMGFCAPCMIPADYRPVYYFDILSPSTGDNTVVISTGAQFPYMNAATSFIACSFSFSVMYVDQLNSSHYFLNACQRRHFHYCRYVLSHLPLELNCFIPYNYSLSYTIYPYFQFRTDIRGHGSLSVTHPGS